MVVCFFFFKQKTAYELRISDCSSDVCSSDLLEAVRHIDAGRVPQRHRGELRHRRVDQCADPPGGDRAPCGGGAAAQGLGDGGAQSAAAGEPPARRRISGRGLLRSEEHTSELQSLMRNSYAVFCLKKKRETNMKESNTETCAIN